MDDSICRAPRRSRAGILARHQNGRRDFHTFTPDDIAVQERRSVIASVGNAVACRVSVADAAKGLYRRAYHTGNLMLYNEAARAGQGY